MGQESSVVITTFTDPMMGLSYECEPVFRKLETHFPGTVQFRYAMAVLVRDVYEFVDRDDLREGKETAIRNYNARLAKIYESEESITGMPINMTAFRLFSTEHTSSLPLNLAYHAARAAAPKLADLFLYNLRYATIVDCRPTTRQEEILAVVRKTGINETAFRKRCEDGYAQAALARDLELARKLEIHTLPAYLIQYQEKRILIRDLIGYDAFVTAIAQVSDNAIKPRAADQSKDALHSLLEAHPLISPIEVREAMDLQKTEEVRTLIQPMLDRGEIAIETIHHGWFIRKAR